MVPDALTPAHCDEIIGAADVSSVDAGSRKLLEKEWCQSVALSLMRHPTIAPLLPVSAVAVQCTLFDKSPQKNWLVSFHQDLSIPVRECVDSPECSGWSQKEGILFVQPPVSVLAQLLAVRVHLDDCGIDNGPLRVVPGSHRHGRISQESIERHRELAGEVACTASRGCAVVIRPLLLHASSKSAVDLPRRVLHFVFGPGELPHGLQRHQAIRQ